MDQAPPAGARPGLRAVAVALAVLLVAVLVVEVGLRRTPASRLLGADTPLVRLSVEVVGDDGAPVPAGSSRLGGGAPSATPSPAATAASGAAVPSPSEPAAQVVALKVERAPIAISIHALRGAELLSWLETNPAASEVLRSDLVQGMLTDVLRTLRVRAEDLKMPEAKGAFLAALARDVVSAGGALHYDPSRGRRGFVVSFERARSAIAGRLLPVALRTLARRELVVDRASLSIVEVLVGEQTLFVTERDGIVYVASSLPAVLNAIEVGPLPAPVGAGTVAVTVRAEAWLQNLLPLAVGSKEWAATWTIDLAKPGGAGSVTTSGGTMFGYLAPAIDDVVLGAIPRDAFAAAAASVPFPKEMSAEDWNRLAHEGLKRAAHAGAAPAGVGVVWDLSQKNASLSEIGVIVRRPAGGESPRLGGYVGKDVFTAGCADDAVWLAATSELLLTRMREACDRQSPSMIDARREVEQATQGAQLFAALNLAPGVRELLDAGAAAASGLRDRSLTQGATTSPEWKQQYLRAVDRARGAAAATLEGLPLLVFQGTASEQGAALVGTTAWPKKETAWLAR